VSEDELSARLQITAGSKISHVSIIIISIISIIVTKPLGKPSPWVCKPAYLVAVPSQDKFGGLWQEEHLV